MLSTFVSCAPSNLPGYRGCLFLQTAADARAAFNNFTDCHLDMEGWGSALYLNAPTLVLVSYLSVVGCSESTVIDNWQPEGRVQIDFANFYQNKVTKTDYGILRVYNIGMILTSCIFSGNSCNNQELHFRSSCAQPWIINDCVFADGWFKPLNYANATWGTNNVGAGPVTSLPLPLLDVAECRHAADVPFPTPLPASPGARSPTFTSSDEPSESEFVDESGPFDATESPGKSVFSTIRANCRRRNCRPSPTFSFTPSN
jgi:hypothetical protein